MSSSSTPDSGSSCYKEGSSDSKTSAINFLKMAYSVYFFKFLYHFDANIVRSVEELLMDESKTIVILADEVASRDGSQPLGELLKMTNPRFIIIGAAVPSNVKSANTGNFRHRIQMSDLILKKTDTDYIEFARTSSDSLMLRAPTISSQVCIDICDFILRYCGGHVYPTLHLISYFSTKLPTEHLQSLADFQFFLFSQEFENSKDFLDLKNRCFDHDSMTEASVDRIMRGVEVVGDMEVVNRLGWWNSDTKDFISTMLKNYCLIFMSEATSPKITLVSDKDHSFFSNTITMLVEGLVDMHGCR